MSIERNFESECLRKGDLIDHRPWQSPAETALLFRACRQLIEEGKPLGQAYLIAVNLDDRGVRPFGVLTTTGKNRTIYWPVAPLEAYTAVEAGTHRLTDHITLELPSMRSHVTMYDEHGNRDHSEIEWRPGRPSSDGLSLWFFVVARLESILGQPLHVERDVPLPLTDSDRRLEEFKKFVSTVKHVEIAVPPVAHDGDYLLACFQTADESVKIPNPPSLPRLDNLERVIAGCPENTEVLFATNLLRPTPIQVLVSIASPPGRCKEEMIGFPSARSG